MTKIIQHHPKEAMVFPRAINQGVELRNVPFEDFTIEVKDVETMGKVEIIHQTAKPNVALQVVHTKDLGEFDKMLGRGLSMHLTIQYIKGDYTFMVIFSGIQGDFAEGDTDPHVRMHRVFDAIRAGAWWYHLYRDKAPNNSH